MILFLIIQKKILINFITFVKNDNLNNINNINNYNNINNNLINNKKLNNLYKINNNNILNKFDKNLFRNNFNENNKKLFEKYIFLKNKLTELKKNNYGERNYDKKIIIIQKKIKDLIEELLSKK